MNRKNKTTASIEQLIAKIAVDELFVETLEVRNMDSLDFHEVSVGGIKRALEAAYKAGFEQAMAEKAK